MTDWILFTPELFTLAGVGVFLTLSLLSPDGRRDHLIALILALSGLTLCVVSAGWHGELFAGAYRVDSFSQVFKCLVYMGFFLVIALCGELDGVSKRRHGEFYLLLNLCTLALMLLISSVHLLGIYLALELSSYSLYILVYLRKGYERGIESALKYFLMGAAASALMLFGVALLYGLGGSLYLADLLRELPGKIHDPVVLVSLILCLSGFLFKLAAFPFHFWASDVYEGAPHQVAAYIATASKVAAIAVLLRLVALSGNASEYLSYFLMALALISMTVGNLAALVQQDFKRLLAFSTIAHAGYVLIGILSVNPLGYASAVFYALSLLVMKYSCFMVVTLASKNGRNPAIADLAGLHRRAPVLALALMLALFGLAGIPPTIGFTAKLLVFMAAMKNGYLALVLIAMINVVISLYYYLQVLKAAYFLEPASDAPEPAPVSAPMQALAGLMIGLMIAGGLYPKQMIAVAGAITQGILL